MKNYYVLTAIICWAMITSCGPVEPDEPQLDDRLVGTIWQTNDDVAHMFYGGTCYRIYEFVSTTQLECYTKRNGVVYESYGTMNYELNYPHLTVHYKESNGAVSDRHYTFQDSRTFTLDGTPGTMAYQIFIRQ